MDPLQKAQFQVDGYVFTSADGKQVVQYRLDGFTFSRLRPYTRWEEVFAEAQKVMGHIRCRDKASSCNRFGRPLHKLHRNSLEDP